jgi:GGDEF domain-containing protein
MRKSLLDYRYKQELSPERFAHMTDWMLLWQQRNPSAVFSLVLIDFLNPTALGNALGAAYAMDLIRRVERDICAVLRATDQFCRFRVSSFLVLLPQGAPEIVLNKIEPIIHAARIDGLDASQLHIAKLVVPDDLGGAESAVDLFDRLAMRREK